MSKLQKFRLIEDKPISRPRMLLDALRGIWQGPISVSSPDIARLFGSQPTATGIQVDHQTALNYSAVWAAVDLISSQVGNLPLCLYSKDANGGKTKMDWHPLYRLIHDRPNEELSAFSWRQTLQAHALTWGNGYAVIRRNGMGRPGALDIITPDRVSPFRRGAETGLEYRIMQSNGGEIYIPAADMIHVKGLSFNGIDGYSMIGKARESIALGIATEKFGGEFFGNGATFGGVLASKGPRPDENTVKSMRESINSRHQGVERAHKMLLTWNDTTYQQLGVPPDDAQFLETRRFQIDEIARWFNIPTHKLKELANGSNRSTTEQQNLEYYIDCLQPWLERWSQELCEKLIAPSERNLQDIEFVVEGLLRGDVTTRGDFHQKRFSTASATPNDLRILENLNPIDGGDDAFVAMNLIPLGLARPYWEASIALTEANTKKALEPPPTPTPTPAPPTREQMEAIAAEIRARDELITRTTAAEAQADTFKRENEALRDELGKERTGHQGSKEAFSLDVTAITQERDQARVEAQTATARTEEVRGQLVTALDDLQRTAGEQTNTTAALVKAETALALANQAIRESDQALTQARAQQTAMRIALRRVLRHAASCLVARESDRARKAQRSPEKLSQWAADFYPMHLDFCWEAIRASYMAWLESGGDGPDAIVTLRAYVADGQRQIQAMAAESDPETLAPNLEKLLRHWETTRVDALVAELTKGTV